MNKKIFIGIGIFWLLIIVGFVAIKEFTLQTGTDVILKTMPVDPRDLFRGDYVILRYEISTLDLNILKTDSEFVENDKVYVSLDIDEEGYGNPTGVYRNQPEELYITGKVTNVRDNQLTVEYGIESYFVPEGQGRVIERQTGKSLSVKVAVDKFG